MAVRMWLTAKSNTASNASDLLPRGLSPLNSRYGLRTLEYDLVVQHRKFLRHALDLGPHSQVVPLFTETGICLCSLVD